MEQMLNMLNTWRCLAETTLSGNYTNSYCYAVPVDVQDALLVVAKFVAEMMGLA